MGFATWSATRPAEEIDPDVRALLDKGAEVGAPDISHCSPEQARADLERLFVPDVEPDPVADVTERLIPAPARDVRVRIFDPDPGKALPAVVYFHGGGWVAGDLETHDGLARSLATEGACVVVSVDYRRAPEHPFPAAIENRTSSFRRSGRSSTRSRPAIETPST
ncbi:alpha/beta hydrolase [Halosolutus gelatinilyticus]|uniref:alpha/beta hydrolase n=1 Tax=Halosolutus gelatinilyticus TaxID=2931975 RepID=UPI001FF692F0|nr:alpha/beta hydrolase [Halosolutus gelatinilyticus]